MSRREELEALAARVEAIDPAAEIDWVGIYSLNEAICTAVTKQGELQTVIPPDYLRSLDAAMTLVPEGWRIGGLSQHDHEVLRARGEWTVWFYPSDKLDASVMTFANPRCRHAATPALALTAAALRARATQEPT